MFKVGDIVRFREIEDINDFENLDYEVNRFHISNLGKDIKITYASDSGSKVEIDIDYNKEFWFNSYRFIKHVGVNLPDELFQM